MRGGLTTRMTIASAMLALLIAGAFAFEFFVIVDVRRAERASQHSQEVLAAANQLERLLLDLETGQRGFVLTGRPQFLEPWRVARRAFPTRARNLLTLVDGARQERWARRIAADEQSYIRDYSVPLVAAARRGDPSARGVEATEEGKQRVDTMRTYFNALLATEQRRADEASRRTDRSFGRAAAASAVALGASLILLLAYVAYLSRAIVRPVRRAALMADRLAGGDLATRLPELSPGEIGALERAFNTMGGSLERNRDELAGLAAEQAALRRVATLVASAAEPQEVSAAVAEEVGRRLGAERTVLGRYEDDSLTVVAGWRRDGEPPLQVVRAPLGGDNVMTRVHETHTPVRVDYRNAAGDVADAAREMGLAYAVGAPIVVEGRLWGLMAVATAGADELPEGTETRLADFTDLVATAIANAETQAALTASRARVVATADATRRRIERDLHDGAQQRLVSLTLQLRGAQADVPAELPAVRDQLERVAQGLNAVQEELREMARGIHPAILAEGGLGPALRTLSHRSALPVELDVHVDGRLPERVEVAAYYVVSEALTNAAKHADASRVNVEVRASGCTLLVEIRDDGKGGASFARGSGLVGLKDRVEALGGRISVSTPRDTGTTLRAEIPLGNAPPSTR